MGPERAELEAFYRRYLERCNTHQFGTVGEFVDDSVEVIGTDHRLRRHVEDWVLSWTRFPIFTGTCGFCWSTAPG